MDSIQPAIVCSFFLFSIFNYLPMPFHTAYLFIKCIHFSLIGWNILFYFIWHDVGYVRLKLTILIMSITYLSNIKEVYIYIHARNCFVASKAKDIDWKVIYMYIYIYIYVVDVV